MLLKSLLDFQFTTLVTVRVIRFVYALIVIFRIGGDVHAIRQAGGLGGPPTHPG